MDSNTFVSSFSDLQLGQFKREHRIIGPTPKSGLRFRIRNLNAGEVSAYQSVAIGKEGFEPTRMKDANRRLIALCLVDGDGNRIISDAQAKVIDEWDNRDAVYVYRKCAAFSGLNRESFDEVEGELEKNSDGTTTGV